VQYEGVDETLNSPPSGSGLSEEERRQIREMVKARRRESSVNQSRDTSPNPAPGSQANKNVEESADSKEASLETVNPAQSVLGPWAAESEKMNKQYAELRAREEALFRKEPPRKEDHKPEGSTAAPSPVPRVLPTVDPLAEKLKKQQDIIQEQGVRIRELDQIVRASAHKTGQELEDQRSEIKDQIVALEQHCAAQSVQHRKEVTKLLDALNKLDALEHSPAPMLGGAGGTLGVAEDEEAKIKEQERQNAEAWLLREREKLLQQQEADAWKVVMIGKEISKYEQVSSACCIARFSCKCTRRTSKHQSIRMLWRCEHSTSTERKMEEQISKPCIAQFVTRTSRSKF